MALNWVPVRICHGWAILAAFLLALPLSVAAARSETALTVEGYSSLYQRVLSRPGATLLDAPGGAIVRELPPFQVFYVYETTEEWTKVGNQIEGDAAGYIETARLLPWKSAIVATFNNRAENGRSREMLFNSLEALRDLIYSESVVETADGYRNAAISGTPLETSGVVAIEPEAYVDIRDRLYIMPILESQFERSLPGRNRGLALKVAVMSANGASMPGAVAERKIENQPYDFVFVIDTTKSMGTYIEATRKAVADVAQRIANGPVGERSRFAIVEFRDNTSLAEGLEYVTRVALPLAPESTIDVFLDRLSEVNQAEHSSSGFNEDSLAGLSVAINQLAWDKEAAKYIFLITDAGPRLESGEVPNLLPEQVAATAKEKGIAIFTWHLLTDAGQFDHEFGAESYRALSRFGDSDLYTAIEQGEPEVFENTVNQTIDGLTKIIEAAQSGQRADEIAPEELPTNLLGPGLAMQLAYLGRDQGATPDVFEGWILDKDIPNFRANGLDIRVMLTRNQLSTLINVLQAITEQMEQAVLDPTTLFSQLRNAMATLAQDGTRLAQGQFEEMGDGLQDYLASLPYRSELMRLTQDDWVATSGAEQLKLRLRLQSKLQALKDYYADPALWTKLWEGAPEGEEVTLVLLDLMP